MINGLIMGASAENSVLSRGASHVGAGSGGCETWRQLDADRRLQLIEHALRTTDGLVDEFSLAL